MTEVNYQKYINEGTAIRDKEVLKQTELTEKIYRLRRHGGRIEFRIDLTDKDREILEPFLKEYPLALGKGRKDSIEYGTVEYVKASPKPGASFLERVRTFLFGPTIPTKVQADYILCDFQYCCDEAATARCKRPDLKGFDYYNKTILDTSLNISFKSKLYSGEKCQFCDVDMYVPWHFAACVHEGNDWKAKGIEWPTRENACFWLWFANKAEAIKEAEKNEYERLFAEWNKGQEAKQAEMDKFAEWAKSI